MQARQRRIRNTIIASGIAAGAAIAIYYALNKDKDDEAKAKEEREKAAQEAAAQKAEIDKQEAEKRALQAEAERLDLASINRSLRRTSNDIDRLVTTVQNLRRFVDAVNHIIGIVWPT